MLVCPANWQNMAPVEVQVVSFKVGTIFSKPVVFKLTFFRKLIFHLKGEYVLLCPE